ncbi:GGDEF domain-containing protein [Selenomonas bovis]|uniref:GGDEF domain-containing protein n=1 Tax=Selenomonas bovis TaxID=416586 RepID=UPI0009DE7CEF|nr:GGDEF domain-containing protein [Selenomonas bovis]
MLERISLMDDAHIAIPSAFTDHIFKKLDRIDQHLYFRWDLTRDVMTLHAPIPRKFRTLPQEVSHASTMLWTQGLLHPADRPILHSYLHTLFQSQDSANKPVRKASCKLRIRHHRNKYLWAEVHLLTYFEDARPMVAFGNLRSIQAQKLWQQRMQRRADQDSLTGLLTKDAAVRQIESTLALLSSERDSAVLLLLDADGFKAINDNFGHLFGDGVLAEMGHTIKRHFRHTDIMGRIGGDEFVILLPSASNLSGIEAHCTALVRDMEHEYKADNRCLPFSISIGAALYPAHGLTYRELFNHADRALYEAKSRGKNQFRMYENKFYQAPQIESQRDTESTVDLQMKAFRDNMAEFILQIFYETNSAKATIDYSLGMLGRLYNFDRIVIALTNQETGTYHDAYEWLGPSGTLLKNLSENCISRRRSMILGHAKQTAYGVMSICEDTATLLQEAQFSTFCYLGAYAYSLITQGEETIGYIGVESTSARQVTPDLIRSLNVLSVMLGNILLPSNTSEHLRKEARILHDVLDHLPGLVYAVDKDTMELVYLGRTIRPADAGSLAGAPCYQLLHGRSLPCRRCPLPALSPSGQEYLACTIDGMDGLIPAHACNLAETGRDGHHLVLIVQDTPAAAPSQNVAPRP